MNAEQIKSKIQEVREAFDAVYEEFTVSADLWDMERPDSCIVERSLEGFARANAEAAGFQNQLNLLLIDLKEVERDGLEPFMPFPESARHLWTMMDICRDIYCERNGFPRGIPGDMLAGLTGDDKLSPLFKAVAMGRRLHRNLSLGIIDWWTFEEEWREYVIEPVIEVLRNVTDSNVQDCLRYVAEAMSAEQARSSEALK